MDMQYVLNMYRKKKISCNSFSEHDMFLYFALDYYYRSNSCISSLNIFGKKFVSVIDFAHILYKCKLLINKSAEFPDCIWIIIVL